MRKAALFFLLFMIFVDEIRAQHRKVLLTDVKTVTLRKGEYTTGRRSSPVQQLKCVGGAAAGRFSPRVAQCTQTGHDGVDVQWKCVAEMPEEYEFGKISVTCEGFDYPEDPYVLYGSCGLEYDLEYSNKQHRKSSDSVHRQGMGGESALEKYVTYAVYAFFVFILIYMFCNCTDGAARRPGGPPPRGGFGGPGYPPGGPPPGPPPPYDSFPKSSGSQGAQQQNEGPGFWTGAGLGALGGYFMGRNQGGGGARQERNFYAPTGGRERTPSPPRSSWSSSGPSTSSATHESTSYGGTRRR